MLISLLEIVLGNNLYVGLRQSGFDWDVVYLRLRHLVVERNVRVPGWLKHSNLIIHNHILQST